MLRSLLGAFILLLALCTSLPAAQVSVSVTASMTDAIKTLISTYQEQSPPTDFLPNVASSGALAQQIAQGAPTDIFISANPKWMTYLVEQGRIPKGQVRVLAKNALVIVGRPGTFLGSMADLSRLQRIAIGSPRSVPAGEYAAQALKAAQLEDALKGKLVIAKDVRQALVYADRGETDAAFVYKTDALLARNAVILLDVPQELYNQVVYPVGLTKQGDSNPAAVAFFDYLQSEQAAEVLRKFGFLVAAANSDPQPQE